MSKDVDCRVFEDQLDALMAGTLPDEGSRQLQVHALSCPDCAMLLKIREHLALPSLAELEAAVPEDLLDSVWPGVKSATGPSIVRTAQRLRKGEPQDRQHFPLAMPLLAAASLILLFSTGLLFAELKRTQALGFRMAEQVAELEIEMAELDIRTEWVERTAELGGASRARARALEYALAGEESITVSDLAELLRQFPQDRVLFTSSQLAELLATPVRPPEELQDLIGALARALAAWEERRDVRAGDLASWLATSGLPPDRVIPKSPLLALLTS